MVESEPQPSSGKGKGKDIQVVTDETKVLGDFWSSKLDGYIHRYLSYPRPTDRVSQNPSPTVTRIRQSTSDLPKPSRPAPHTRHPLLDNNPNPTLPPIRLAGPT